MNKIYEMTVGIIPVCTSCGKELAVQGEQKPPDYVPNGPFDKLGWINNTTQRVYIQACPVCFIHKSEASGKYFTEIGAAE